MSVNYAPSKLKVPAGFQCLFEGLAREVLRVKPDDIIQFADRYFKQKLKKREAGESSEPFEEQEPVEQPSLELESLTKDDEDKSAVPAQIEEVKHSTLEQEEAAVKI